ncbi:MobC family plasmid mobilization relaxosome protein [Acinetobacter sp. ANC 4862]|jgi:hypothetical protein|uniref:MobC family plasmid mobilization relaxosome protein n=1 Tax=Acinetobacter sp. ANC 4862 TaxID=2529849 RepID=UPI001040208B|nr:MobC family plasmid mobilization relaxosome protein [Acinetobacter sp. ANC 4862]TCH62487.1 plasmid mobilization relaxosome protein MobC [Acinetobacter sp. ANC 4862]
MNKNETYFKKNKQPSKHRPEIQFEKKRPVRTRVVKVTLFETEYELLQQKNMFSSIARLMREAALTSVKNEQLPVTKFSKLDREFLLELSRIGNNINQIAKAVNLDLASYRPLDAVKLLHLLLHLEYALNSLKAGLENDC